MLSTQSGTLIHQVRGPYTVFPEILSHVNTEGVSVIPQNPCTFNPGGCNQGQGNGAFFLGICGTKFSKK
jgi:hypothetical protein